MRRVVAEHDVVRVLIPCFGGAREHGLLVGGQRGLDIVGVRRDGPAELGSVQHGEVGAFAVRGCEVRGIADQGHPRHPSPAVPGRQRVEGAHDRYGVAVGDQRGKLGRPPVELGGDPRRHRRAVLRIGAGEPVRWLLELCVRVQGAAAFAVSQQTLIRREREH